MAFYCPQTLTTIATNDKVLEALGRVQRAVYDNAAGDAGAHAKLLNEIRLLRAVIEAPEETATRIRFHVSISARSLG
jgi:hypothetical protein